MALALMYPGVHQIQNDYEVPKVMGCAKSLRLANNSIIRDITINQRREKRTTSLRKCGKKSN